MRILLDDFIERNTSAAIVVPPKCARHPGVHGIDAHLSPPARPSFNGTIFRRLGKAFRSLEFF
ncbi:hypothetical protein [Burkholderia sp. SCN-KJ]|uniref:hypothetical protein n=1 Tax=Burkholderia sp. SCN-KJ TaxID=2969248 RepID=UPI00214FBBF7|nr:hypothetical protein [Burkholderia sp. SCN-KJ]MCR4466062.1 hypothetical protein [Burkholderia sp. SCN-KJ]